MLILDQIAFDNLTSDPSVLEEGMMWYRSDLKMFRKYVNGTVVSIEDKNIIVDSITISSSHTGDLLETVIGVLTIPANIFQDGDWLNFLSIAQVDTDSTKNRFYINTSPTLDGNEVPLLYYNQGSSINIKLFADFLISGGKLKGWKSSAANSVSVYGNVTGTAPDLTVDFTQTQYLIYTCQLAINTKTFSLKGFYLERKRK